MRLSLWLCLVLTACRGAALPHDADLSMRDWPLDSTDPCPLRIDQICGSDGCLVDGATFPLTSRGWCQLPPDAMPILPPRPDAGIACGDNWTSISMLNGDQGILFFYDASDHLAAVMQWVSDPPCLGACRFVCVAGPADLRPTDIPQSCREAPLSQPCSGR
jgi:hypothetical protein